MKSSIPAPLRKGRENQLKKNWLARMALQPTLTFSSHRPARISAAGNGLYARRTNVPPVVSSYQRELFALPYLGPEIAQLY